MRSEGTTPTQRACASDAHQRQLVSCVGTYDTLLPIVEAARRAVTGMPAPGIRGQREER